MRSFICLSFVTLSLCWLSACKQGSNTPTSPLAPVTSAPTTLVTVTATSSPLVHYQGPNPYRQHPRFDLAYDPLQWSLIGDEGTYLGNRLRHKEITDCYVRLQSGPLGALSIATISLAGREWTILQVQSKILQYSFLLDDIAFIFDIILPEEYSPTTKSDCQAEAEQVLDTFQMLD